MHSFWEIALLALLPLTFAEPKAKTTSARSTSTCSQTLCVDYVNSCGLRYGGCYAACKGVKTPTFTDPGCPTVTSTTTRKTLTTTTAKCGLLCKDYFDDCGNTYGPGCYTACPGVPEPSYTTPYCSITATTTSKHSTSTKSSSCGFICQDYFDDCGNTYGPGCYTACPGVPEPSYTTPFCSITTTPTTTPTKKSTQSSKCAKSSSSCGFICQDYFDDCGNTYGPGCYTSCPGQAPPPFTTPYCSVTGSMTTMANTHKATATR